MDPDIEQIIRDYIKEIVHMSLATSSANKPWVCEVHFAYDKNLNLYYRSLVSRRHSKEIKENPSVAGNIIKQHDVGQPAVGVYFEGTAHMLSEFDEQQTAAKLLTDRLQPTSDILEESKNPEGHQFYKITVDTFYAFGAFNDKAHQKYSLPWNKKS